MIMTEEIKQTYTIDNPVNKTTVIANSEFLKTNGYDVKVIEDTSSMSIIATRIVQF